MRITIVTGPFHPMPPLQGGAIERRWQGIAEEFAARGHNVTIICRAYPGQPSREIINRVNYVRRSGYSRTGTLWADLPKDLAYSLAAATTIPAGDIVVTNAFWLPLVIPLLRRRVGKLVVHVARFPKRQHILYPRVARFDAVSKAVAQALKTQYPSLAEKVRVIPNPIDTQVLRPRGASCRVPEKPTILFVGRLHPEKGVHLLVEGFVRITRDFPNATLKLVGPVSRAQGGAGTAYLNALLQKAQGKAVEFHAPVYKLESLAQVYQSANLFCYPSVAEKGESFGVAPLEAMACGVVPVVSDLACFRDFIVPRQNGFVFDHRGPDAAHRLAAVLIEALSHPEQLRKMSHHAALKAAEFSYERIAEQYLKDFEELCQERSYP